MLECDVLAVESPDYHVSTVETMEQRDTCAFGYVDSNERAFDNAAHDGLV